MPKPCRIWKSIGCSVPLHVFKVASDLGSPKLRSMGLRGLEWGFFWVFLVLVVWFFVFFFSFNKDSKPAASIQTAVRNIQYF